MQYITIIGMTIGAVLFLEIYRSVKKIDERTYEILEHFPSEETGEDFE